MFAVIDTNVIVASLLTHNHDSATARVMDAVYSGKVTPLVCDEMLAEYADVLYRPRLKRGVAYSYACPALYDWNNDGLLDLIVGANALTYNATSSANGWAAAAVPEPTSGLLMLLGMAGLALRRRRA